MGRIYANVELLNATDVDMVARHQIDEKANFKDLP